MTKQEEIREGVAQQLAQFDGRDWGELSLEAKGTYKGRAIVLGCYLNSQGVVIRGKSELPENPHYSVTSTDKLLLDMVKRDRWVCDQAYTRMLKAGYVKVEPLVDD